MPTGVSSSMYCTCPIPFNLDRLDRFAGHPLTAVLWSDHSATVSRALKLNLRVDLKRKFHNNFLKHFQIPAM